MRCKLNIENQAIRTRFARGLSASEILRSLVNILKKSNTESLKTNSFGSSSKAVKPTAQAQPLSPYQFSGSRIDAIKLW